MGKDRKCLEEAKLNIRVLRQELSIREHLGRDLEPHRYKEKILQAEQTASVEAFEEEWRELEEGH